MYNEIILSKLNNLKYLSALKNSNVTATSKKNKYNDIVKFYAQINKEDVIQKISYKATGCTYFLVFCDYFCELAEGKNLKSALKINGEKLETLIELTESRKHVVDIIVNTFALLVKKYRNGVEKGLIIPCDEDIVKSKNTKKSESKLEKVEKKTDKEKTYKSTTKSINGSVNSRNNGSKKVSKSNKNEKTVKQESNIESLKSMISNRKQQKVDDISSQNIVVEEVKTETLEEVVVENNSSETSNQAKKKSLFSWFRKNK